MRNWFYDPASEPTGNTPPATTEKIEVDGKVVELTSEALKAAAQKGLAILPKIQSEKDSLANQLKTLQEELAAHKNVSSDFRAAVEDDGEAGDTARRNLLGHYGYSEAEINAILSDDEGETEEEEKASPSTPLRVSMEHLDPSLRALLEDYQASRLKNYRETVLNDMQATLRNDELFGKMATGKTAKYYDHFAKSAQNEVQRRVTALGAKPGPELYKAIVSELRDVASQVFGIQVGEDDAKSKKGLKDVFLGQSDPSLDAAFQLYQSGQKRGHVSMTAEPEKYKKDFAADVLARLAAGRDDE